MSYHETVSALAQDPEQLEHLYREALRAGEAEAFQQAIVEHYTADPENLLYAAWFHRLKLAAARARGHIVAWAWAIPLAIANGLLCWSLSGETFMLRIRGFRGPGQYLFPAIALLAGPLCAAFVLLYLACAGPRRRRPWRAAAGGLLGILLLAAAGYVLLAYPQAGPAPYQEQYLILMVMHLPLLAWAGVGLFLIARHRDAANRFAFLIKSLETFILGGLFVIAGGIFTGITIGLFQALNVELPEPVARLFLAGGAGLLPVIAAAVIYDPAQPPAKQAFDEGLSKLAAIIMRILLPLSLLVLVVYLFFIPFNFRAPFDNRDVLIIYNGMLFAVVALLVGATPVSVNDLGPRLARWLRAGILAVAALALIVSLYALAAISYRTALDRLTPNRLAFIGWNVVNIGLLALVLLHQVRAKEGRWLDALKRAYRAGTVAYAVWALVMILALPWIFGIDQQAAQALPTPVQRIVYDYPNPILQCPSSRHVYLLDRGEKRWIDSMETFTSRGYVWKDVHQVTCEDLRSILDGVPIPAGAGPAPEP
jgi:hypothetical protein